MALLVASPAAAWQPLRDARGAPLSWPDDAWPLPLADASSAWTRAAAHWTQLADVAFWPVEAAAPGPDGVVTLALVDSADAWAEQVGDEGLVGFTIITHDAAGTLLDADVVVNFARFEPVDPPTPRRHALLTVLGHELGHVLGLGHSCGAEGPACGGLEPEAPEARALMFPRIPPGELRRPGVDDLAGLAARVELPEPPRRPVVESVEPRADGWAVWLSDARPEDRLRAWSDGSPAPTVAEPGPPWRLRAPGTPPLDLEVWSAAGQGQYLRGALAAPDAGVNGAADAAVEVGAELPGERAEAGCRQAPAGSAAALLLLLLGARRRR